MKITKLSKSGLDLIKQHEGFCSEPYLCPASVGTIGYGSTYYEDGTKVKLGDPPITEERASKLLASVLVTYEKAVDYALSRYVTNFKILKVHVPIDKMCMLSNGKIRAEVMYVQELVTTKE